MRTPISCQYEFVSALAAVNNANQRIVIWSARTRPMRSARMPVTQPPSADDTRAAVASMPASPRVMPHRPISVGMTKL